jgi:hypothetical protein
MIDEEKHRLTERLAWPVLSILCLSSLSAVVLLWGVHDGRLIAAPILVGSLILTWLSVAWFRKWRRAANAYIPQERLWPDPSNTPLRTYPMPWWQACLWYIPQTGVFLLVLYIGFQEEADGRHLMLGALMSVVIYTAFASSALDGCYWLARKWKARRRTRYKKQRKLPADPL